MLSKLKYTPFVLLIALVVLHDPKPAARAALVPHQPGGFAAWQPPVQPTVAFTSPSADANTLGAFTISLAFNNQGGSAIDPGSLQVRASRSVTVASSAVAAGSNLAAVSGFLAASTTSGASVSVTQGASGILFADGEYVLHARVSNTAGVRSEWVSRRIFINGALPTVIKAAAPLK